MTLPKFLAICVFRNMAGQLINMHIRNVLMHCAYLLLDVEPVAAQYKPSPSTQKETKPFLIILLVHILDICRNTKYCFKLKRNRRTELMVL
jgi:hypothetical protein